MLTDRINENSRTLCITSVTVYFPVSTWEEQDKNSFQSDSYYVRSMLYTLKSDIIVPTMKSKKSCLFLCLILFSTLSFANETKNKQTMYIPAYSNIYFGNQKTPISLTITLMIRNTDPLNSIRIKTVNYYDSKGKMINSFLDSDLLLRPLSSTEYVIPHKDKEGGSGASFIVKWDSEKEVNTPIIESIMTGNQGVSFTARGKEIYN
ncbi:Protein of unknown function [Marinobacterium iners DSM 11526]|uniref:DUF3124 domain-containing protein n=2 Tax=Marinobacterium iners TaxID=48076 RepID=A0A1H4C261_9GAMM|nr:Protein of unknown function [Marinobacterium iners DSM 11526]